MLVNSEEVLENWDELKKKEKSYNTYGRNKGNSKNITSFNKSS